MDKKISVELGDLTAQEAVTYLAALFQAFAHTAGFVVTTGGIDKLNEIERTVLAELRREFTTEGGVGHPGAPKKEGASMVKLAFETVRKAYAK